MRILTATLFLVWVLFAQLPATAQQKNSKDTSGELQQELAELKKEADSLKVEWAAAEAEKASLAEEEKRLTSTADLLKGAWQNLRVAVQDHVRDASAQQSAVKQHNGNRCTYPEGRPEVCDAYVAEARRLNTWRDQIAEREKTLRMRETGLQERQTDLSHATLEWAQKKKTNNARQEDLAAQERTLVARVKQFTLDDRFLKDLRLRKTISEHCRSLAESGSLEAASQCLQQVWDGARRPTEKLGTARKPGLHVTPQKQHLVTGKKRG
jgi:hypothetical protein